MTDSDPTFVRQSFVEAIQTRATRIRAEAVPHDRMSTLSTYLYFALENYTGDGTSDRSPLKTVPARIKKRMTRETDWAMEAPRNPFQEISPMLMKMFATKVARVAKAGSHIRFAACIACMAAQQPLRMFLKRCKPAAQMIFLLR